MRKKILSRKGIILLVCITIAIIIVSIYTKLKDDSFFINEKNVKSIDVNIVGELQQAYYCKDPKFTVVEASNIQYILDTIKSNEDKNQKKYDQYTTAAVEYAITINLKDDSTQKYTLKAYQLSTANFMSEVLSSKEVVQQIRTPFTIDTSVISKVEFYYWEDENAEKAKSEVIEDNRTIENILQIAKLNVLSDANKSMESTKCGFVCSDSSGTAILVLNVYSGMEGYNDLLKIKPLIKNYV
ncbi:MAG: hypothetical protein Q4F05_05725 [bacterium]|nr:hypothetical protein [bacterium]